MTLRVTEIKAFVPSKNFELSKQFYKDLGFTMASEGGGIAYFVRPEIFKKRSWRRAVTALPRFEIKTAWPTSV